MEIEKSQNIYFNSSIKRIVEISKHARQITLQDERFYQRNKTTFYPSVTHVLSYFPKAKFFETWAKDVGHNIDIILRRAGEEGTMVHTGIEKILKGEELRWIEASGYVNYPTGVWKMIGKFKDFWETYKPKLIASECHLFSDEYKYAGTGDIVCEIEGELWLIDVKTSNFLYRAHDLQIAAYTVAWNESHDTPIGRRGLLWLKSSKRKEGKPGKQIQGNGWELKESGKPLEQDFELFKLAYRLFEIENEGSVPMTEVLPNIIKLDI